MRALLLLALASCADPNPLLVTNRANTPPDDIVAACDLARTRCSRCHPIERVTHARITAPDEWRAYVHKMRLMPGSAIPAAEEPVLASCFIYRTTEVP